MRATTGMMNVYEESVKLAQFKCRVCEYIYDEEKGDPSSGIAPGTTFDDIPDDWVCPICRLGKDLFEQL